MYIIKSTSNLTTQENYLKELGVEFLLDNGKGLFADVEISTTTSTDGDGWNTPRETFIDSVYVEVLNIESSDEIELTKSEKLEFEKLIKDFITLNIE